jgi:RNA polymerase sigma-70 factor (ECF subfamily)
MDQVLAWLEQYRTATHLDLQMVVAEKLAERVTPSLHRYLRACCPRSAVDDVLQETLVAITLSLPRFKGGVEFEQWCFGIARHKLANYFATERRHKAESLEDEEIRHLIENSTDCGPLTAEERADLEEALEMVRQARPQCSKHLELRFFYGMEHEEIGRALGKSAAAARLQVKRCLKLAQALVAKKGALHV